MNASRSRLQRVLTTLLALCLSFSLSVPTQAIAFAREQVVGTDPQQEQVVTPVEETTPAAVTPAADTEASPSAENGGETVGNTEVVAASDSDKELQLVAESVALAAKAGDVVVKTPADFKFTKKWNDNNNEGGVRPANDTFASSYIELYYKIDNASTWTKLTTSNMKKVGLTAMPTPTYTANAGSVSYKYVLPSEITVYTSATASTDKTVTWSYTEKEVAGYVDPTDQNLGNNSEIKNTLLSDWEATVKFGDNKNLYDSRVAVDSVIANPGTYFEVYRYVDGHPSTATAIDPKSIGFKVTEQENGDWKITFDDAPAFDEDGNPYTYYVKDKKVETATGKDSALAKDPEGIGDYGISIRNVNNHATNESELYENGTLNAVLFNDTTFKVTKTWEDGGDVDGRPSTKLWLYRVSEGENHELKSDAVDHANPVQGNDNQNIAKNVDVVEISFPLEDTYLPMYDNQGHKYIYFALETGISGDYKVVTNNTSSDESAETKDFFNKIKNSDGYAKYVLNNGTITNDREASQTITATKQFTAAALQNMSNTSVQYTLYKKTSEGWAAATAADIESLGDNTAIVDGKVVTTITGFKPEAMEISAAGPVVQKYDVDTGERFEFKYVESAMSVNGGDMVTVQYDMAADGTVTYQTVRVGDVAPGIGSQKTTVYFNPIQRGATTIENVLESQTLVTIEKVWIDANGKNVSGDETAMDGVYAEFQVYRNGEAFGNRIALNISNYDSAKDLWYWQDKYDRYDANGNEYTFTIKEVNVFDPKAAWGSTFEYQTTVDDTVVTGDSLINRTIKYRNVQGPGTSLTFDIQKEWLDDTDTITRATITYGIYDLTNNKLVETGTLGESNNWFERVYVSDEGGTRYVNEFVVVELAVGDVTTNLETSYEDIHNRAMAGKNVDVSNRVGTVGNPDAADSLSYVYNIYISCKETGGNYASYLIDNQRDATLDLKLVKKWNVGDDTEKLTAQFFVYRNGTKLTKTDLDRGCTIEGATLNADGSFSVAGSTATSDVNTVKLTGLDKFDNDGVEYHYALVEASLNDVVIENNRVEVDGDSYVSSVSLDEEATQIKGKAEHHSGDLYVWKASNTKQETFTLDSYKVWRDKGSSQTTNRPDVSFDVYRVSYQENAQIESLVNAGNIEDLTALLQSYRNTKHAVLQDRFWNTKHNDWCWSCNLGSVERYDSDGYPYVYFLVENYTSAAGVYVKGYSNQKGVTPNTSSSVTSTKEVFDTPSEDLDTNMLIIHDGTEAQYSKTTVNYRYDNRTVSGRKIWNVLPSLLDIPDANKPSVTVELYRSSERITELEGDYNQSVYDTVKEKYIDTGALTYVNTTTLNASGAGDYGFIFSTELSGDPLKKYDDWGQEYYYYVFEAQASAKELEPEYPVNAIQITGTDFHITNVYDVNEPVEITITKTWSKNATEDPDLDPQAPAKFELYAQAVDSQGNKVGNEILMSTAVLKTDGTDNYTTSFTFKNITEGTDAAASGFDASSYKTLPYYAPNDVAYRYYVNEVSIPSGYTSNWDELAGTSFESPVTLSGEGPAAGAKTWKGSVGTTTDPIDNEYGKSFSFKVSKKWIDANAYDENYRVPVTLTVSRTWAANTVNGVTIPGGKDEVYVEVALTSADLKSGTTDVWEKTITEVNGHKVQEYAPNGSKFVYAVTAEKATNSADQTKLTNNYTFTKSGTTGTNTLKRVTSLKANKEFIWTNNTTIGKDDFTKLSKLKALPTSITFAVQRSDNDDAFQYVKSNGERTGNYSDTEVLKTTKTITENSTSKNAAAWTNLPMENAEGTTTYTYRVVEILTWTNADGTTNNTVWYSTGNSANEILQAKDKNYYPETGSLSVVDGGTATSKTATYKFKNAIPMTTITLVKKWQGDNLNRDNTRPQYLYITAKSKISDFSADITMQKNAVGTDNWTTTYLFPTPDKSKKITDLYEFNETVGKNPNLFKLYTLASESLDAETNTYTVTNELTKPDRKLVNVSATKTFANDSDFKDVTQTRIQFKIFVQAKGGTTLTQITDTNKGTYVDDKKVDDFQCVQEVEISENTGTVTWKGLHKYWELESGEAGDPKRIVYVIQEDLLDEAGNVLATHSYQAGANPKTPSTLDPQYSDDNTQVQDVNAGTLTNALVKNPVKVTKSWTNSRGETIDAAAVKDLVSKGALPTTIQYGIEWNVGDGWVTVPGTGTADFKTVDLATAGATGVTWDANVPKYDKNGNEISYRVVEKAISFDNGTTWINNDGTGAFDGNIGAKDLGNYTCQSFLANSSNVMSSGSIKVSKKWDDEENAYNDRTNVTIKLYRDGTLYDTQTLKADNNWTYTWANVPVYQNGSKTDLSTWKIEETAITGYTVSYEPATANTGFTVGVAQTVALTATNTLDRTEIPAMKLWEDEANQDGKRPESITFTVKGYVDNALVYDGAKKDTGHTIITGSSTDNTGWSTPYTFENLPKYINCKLVSYTVDENVIGGYTDSKVTKDGTVVHTNTYKPEVVTIAANKTWAGDTGYEDITRPDSITYTVKAQYTVAGTTKHLEDQTMTGQKANNYAASLTGLPKYAEGALIEYSVVETDVPGYTKGEMQKTVSDNTYTFSVTNTMSTTYREADKVWNDENNKDGKRPATITYELTGVAGGQQVVSKEQTVPEGTATTESWYYKWENLPTVSKYGEITYTVTEKAVTYYELEDTKVEGNKTTFTNKYAPERVSVPATKKWDDNANQDGLRPKSITYKLTAKTADGQEITDAAYSKTQKVENGSATTDEGWSYAFTNLYKYYDGKVVTYTVTEDAVEYYTTEASGDMEKGFTFVNKHNPSNVTIAAEKAWAGDTGYEDTTRPASITYTVKGTYTVGSETKSVETKTMTGQKADDYKASLSNMPKMAEGQLINYTVDEITVPGYTTVQGEKQTSDDGLTYTYKFTNTMVTTVAEADKVWDDNANQDGKRPVTITYVLTAKANGQTVTALCKEQQVTGNSKTNADWYYKWENLPTKAYVDGTSYDVTYTVTEKPVDPYTLVGTKTDGTKTTFTNKYTPETTSATAIKKWAGEKSELKQMTRPGSITYTLTATVDGTKVATLCKTHTVTPTDKTSDTGWDYTFENLDKYYDGKIVTYEITEVAVNGYTTTVEKAETGATFTFTNTVEYTEREADKVWDDVSNQDGKRPLELTYKLKAEITVAGQAVEYTALSSEVKVKGNAVDNTGWYYKWSNLPKYIYSGGACFEVTYSVSESGYDPYTLIDTKVDGTKTVFTNQYIPETVKTSATKQWSNEIDSLKEQTRPDSITYTLSGTFTDNEGNEQTYTPTEASKTAKPAAKAGDEGWGVEWTNLPKYAPGYQGCEISYDVAEATITGYQTTQTAPAKSGTDTYGNTVFTVAFNNSLIKTSVDVEKIWSDDDNRDAVQPGNIVISLHANGATEAFLGKTATLNKGNEWKATFTELPKYFYKNGTAEEVAYTVIEDEVPEWYKASTTGTAGEGYKVTNTHEPFTTEVSVSKTWDFNGFDEAQKNLVMPESITFKLTGKIADGTQVYTDSYTADADDNWGHTFTNLPAYAEGYVGQVITYTVEEVVPTGFDMTVTSSKADKIDKETGKAQPGVQTVAFNFTNTLQVTEVEVTKIWDDETDRDGMRPGSVEFGLLESDNKFVSASDQYKVTLNGSNEENTWTSKKFTNLPKYLYENGSARLADYSVEELVVPDNYTVEIVKTSETSFAYEATNTHDPLKTTVDVYKYWADQENLYGFRPGEITFTLTGTIPAGANSGMASIEGIISSFIPVTPVQPMEKVVVDAQEITVTGDPTSETEAWYGEFTDLYVYAEHGQQITYKVFEDIPGYEGELTTDSYFDDEGIEHFTFEFDNTQIVTTIEATKVWDDQNDVDKLRPESITFVMTGTVTIEGLEATCVTVEKTVGKAENWKATWEDLPVYYTDGTPIVYTVSEKNVPKGYTVKVTGDAENGFTVTNTHTPPSKTPKTGDETPLATGLGMLGVLSMAALGLFRTRRKFEGRKA